MKKIMITLTFITSLLSLLSVGSSTLIVLPDPEAPMTKKDCAKEALTAYDNMIHQEVDNATAFQVAHEILVECEESQN
jgi:hypothetical protein